MDTGYRASERGGRDDDRTTIMILPEAVDAPTLLLTLLVYLAAGLVKGALGFGLPLTAMALLPFVLPIEIALGVNAVMLFVANGVQLARSGQANNTVKRFWPVALGVLVAAPLAAMTLTGLDRDTLSLVLGLAICLFSGLSLLAPTMSVPPRVERRAGMATGLLAGAAAALTTVNGPIFVIYLLGLGLDRRAMMAALGLCLLVSGVAVSGAFMGIGLLDGPRLTLAAICLVPALLGMGIGDRLAARLPAARFRALVIGAVFVLGANLVWRSL